MPAGEVTLRGNWVVLEPLRLAHLRELFPDALEPGLFQYIAPGAEGGIKQLRGWVERRLEEAAKGSGLPFLQRDSVTRKAFGCTAMFNISRRQHRLEIGHTWMCKSHRRTPANTEGKLLLLTHAFEEMRAVRVQFKCDVRNEQAIRALERIGAVREGRMRNARVLVDGWIQDMYVYSIIDREWPEVKTRLHALLWNRPDVMGPAPALPTAPAPASTRGLTDPTLSRPTPRPSRPPGAA
jgi:RimJ/RimL family protein N-acetyltransferase